MSIKAEKQGLVSKLRFPEFREAGDWESDELGKVAVFVNEKIPVEQVALENYVSTENILQDYSLVTVKRRYGGVVSRGVFRGKSIKVKTQFLLQENDFLISKRQIVHCACGVVPITLDGSIVSNEYSVLRARDGFDVLFFDYFAQQPAVSQSFLRCSIGIVIEKMLFKLNDWLKEEFLFPSLQEQQKIADCIKQQDDDPDNTLHGRLVNILSHGNYQFRREEERYARRVPMEQIEANSYNLNISRYISTAQADEEIDLQAVNAELITLAQNIEKARAKHNAFLEELGLPALP